MSTPVIRLRLDRLTSRAMIRPALFAAVAVLMAATAWGAVGAGLWYAHDLVFGVPGHDALRRLGDMAQATTVFDGADRPAFTIFKEQRIEVPLAEVSPEAVRAFVAIEDQRFFEHRGIDLVRVVAAGLTNLREGRAAQGGSTITQQLARQSLLTRDKTVRRKLKEVILAARIERLYTKNEILELYLNKAYFGDGLYGIEAAARGFLGKHASELDLAEAALLAGLVKSPSTFAPTVSLERALARRQVVLQAMRDAGALSDEEWRQAQDAPVVLADTLREHEPHGQYFKEQVRLELVERFGWDRVYQGGLRVFTTIDLEMQKAAERLMDESLGEIDKRREGYEARRRRALGTTADPEEPLQGALIALDPRTGFVRAMIGGRSFEDSRFNRAIQARRQPGSAFKPFVFAAALESGYSPASIIDRLDEPVQTLQGEWVPEDEHSGARSMNMRTALRTSSNRAAVRMLETVGIPSTVSYAERLGVGSLPSVPSLALGSGEVTLKSLSAAFAAFANGGLVYEPMLVRRVEDRDGTVLFEQAPAPERAVTETTAFLMATMLADVVNHGTAYRARAVGFTLPAGGKTGTTNDFVDAWFVGFTPNLLAGVWIGFDRPRTIIPNGYAAELAVPLWARFMKEATRQDKPVWLATPDDVVSVDVCRMSGQRPSAGCYDAEVLTDEGYVERRSLVYGEYFAEGTEPAEVCTLHPTRNVFDRVAGLFGARESPPIPADQAGVPARQVQAPAAAAKPAESADDRTVVERPAPKKKRGFWARVFGIGREADKTDETNETNDEQPDDRRTPRDRR